MLSPVWIQVKKEEDPSSPLDQTYVGPEKLLSLFSETNWNGYCLSYLLTNRDFSGVLGLAWGGKPGNISTPSLRTAESVTLVSTLMPGTDIMLGPPVLYGCTWWQPTGLCIPLGSLLCDLCPQSSLLRREIEAKTSDNITPAPDNLLKNVYGMWRWSSGSCS